VLGEHLFSRRHFAAERRRENSPAILSLVRCFLNSQLELAPNIVCTAAKGQRESLKNPSKSVAQYLESLERQGLPQTESGLRQFAELI